MKNTALTATLGEEGRGGEGWDVDVSCTVVGDFLRVPVPNHKEILFQRYKIEVLVKHLQ